MDHKIKKNLIYCNNCGRNNHEFRDCHDPITSYGIIMIQLDNYLSNIRNYLLNNSENKIELTNTDIINSLKDIEMYSEYSNSIKFLMIQRKYTLGYIEFIRGRYQLDNVNGIIFLFQQMTQDEIDNIAKGDFDKLWYTFWDFTQLNSINLINEYEKAKEKYLILKNEKNELNLNFFVKNVIPAWKHAEWGFPKGRRNKMEDNITCAIREFKEETDFKENEFIILNNIIPIIEDFTGTNGIKYRHIYYIAINNKEIENVKINSNNTHQRSEIGDIKFFNYQEAIKIIRPYHIAKKNILTIVYMYLLNNIIKYI